MKNNYIKDKLNLLKGGEKIDSRFKQELLMQIIEKSTNENMKKFSFSKSFVIPPLALGVLASLVLAFTSGINVSRPRDMAVSTYPSEESRVVTDSFIAPENSGANLSAGKAGISLPYYPMSNRVTDSEKRYYNTNASVTLETEDVNTTLEKVKDLVTSADGILDSISLSKNQGDRDYAYVSFNVPQSKVLSVYNQLKGLGYKVTAEYLNMNDITASVEGDDQNSQIILEDYQTQIDRLKELVDDVRTTEAQRRSYENQIEDLEKLIEQEKQRMSEYKEDLNYATLSVSLEEPRNLFDKFFNGFGNGYFGDLISSGGTAFLVLFLLIRFIGHLIVWFLVFSIIWLPVWFVMRMLNKRKVAQEQK